MYTSARDIMSSVKESSDLLIEVRGDNQRKLKETLLEIMQDVHDVCVKHDIEYALVGGSALGAVRHKGFIPWDDDLDISMFRTDFEKFKAVFENELSDKYIFDAPNYQDKESKCNFGKIYKKGTELWEVQDTAEPFPFPRGIYIDVFIYENVSEKSWIRKIDAFVSDFMKGVGTSMIYWKYNSKILMEYYGVTPQSKKYYKKRRLLGLISFFIPHKVWVNMFDKFVSRHKKESDYITAPTGRKYYMGEIIKRSWWSPMKLADFEGHQFFIPADVHHYLQNLYGSTYMQLPPEEKRERHFCVKLDFGQDSQTI